MSQDFVSLLKNKESIAYYEGSLTGLPSVLVGKLFMTQKYLAFHIHEVKLSGLLEKPKLLPTNNIVSIPIERIVSVQVEQGTRAKASKPDWRKGREFLKVVSGEKKINTKPRLLDSAERYSRLVLTVETDYGVEIAYFEVDDILHWQKVIASRIKKGVQH